MRVRELSRVRLRPAGAGGRFLMQPELTLEDLVYLIAMENVVGTGSNANLLRDLALRPSCAS